MTWSRVRPEISGPLAPYEAGFTKWLLRGQVCQAAALVRQYRRELEGWPRCGALGLRRTFSVGMWPPVHVRGEQRSV